MRKVCQHNWALSTDDCVPDGRTCLEIQDTQRVVCHHTRFWAPCDQVSKCVFDDRTNVLLNEGESVVCHHYAFREFGATCDCAFVDNKHVRKVTGLLSLVLYPQRDGNPPHKVHPITDEAVFDWTNPPDPILWIRNASGRTVWLYMRKFIRNSSAVGESESKVPPVSSNHDQQSVEIPYGEGHTSITKVWYGFAYQGEYADASAYFDAHPAGHGHHTQDIPPSGG